MPKLKSKHWTDSIALAIILHCQLQGEKIQVLTSLELLKGMYIKSGIKQQTCGQVLVLKLNSNSLLCEVFFYWIETSK
jgi:hypothetical protein